VVHLASGRIGLKAVPDDGGALVRRELLERRLAEAALAAPRQVRREERGELGEGIVGVRKSTDQIRVVGGGARDHGRHECAQHPVHELRVVVERLGICVDEHAGRRAGGAQAGFFNRPLPMPYSVTVYDANNRPVPGVSVAWQIITGGGTLSTNPSITNSSGVATTIHTLGTATTYVVSATVTGLPSVTFTATASAPP